MAKQLGEVCAGPGECDSSACVDGVCCDRACAGGCELCNAAGSVGTCKVSGSPAKCGVECLENGLFRNLACDGTSAECTPLGDGQTCGGAGCVVLASGKGVCAQCSAAIACPTEGQSCVDGKCVVVSAPPPAGCQVDADCNRADLRCVAGSCQAPVANGKRDFSSIEPLPLDESCGCRLPGAGGGIEGLPAGFFATLCAGLVLLRRKKRWRARVFVAGALAASLGAGTIALGACSPQEDLPANQACIDTPIALSAVVLACTGDYDAARRVGNGFEGKYQCQATDVADTPRYYRCPADLRALPCADVKTANGDYEQLLGRSAACRLLFTRPDGSEIPPLTTSPPPGGAGGGGGGGSDAAGAAGDAGATGGTP